MHTEKQFENTYERNPQERSPKVVKTHYERLSEILKFSIVRLAVGQKRYSGVFMDGTAGNNDPFDLRSVFHQKIGADK